MKKLPLIFISAIIVISAIMIFVYVVEPYRIKRHNRIAEGLYKEAEIAYGNKRYSRALELYKKIVDRYYKSAHTFSSLEKTVEILDTARKREEQKKYLTKFLKLFAERQESARWVYRLAEVELIFFGNDKEAERFYRMVIDKYPSSEWVQASRFKLAELAHRSGNLSEAIIKTQDIIEDAPPSREKDYLYLKNAEAYWRLGRHDDAYETAKKIGNPEAAFIKNNLIYNQIIVKFEPTAKNYLNLAEAYKRLGFDDKAAALKKKGDGGN